MFSAISSVGSMLSRVLGPTPKAENPFDNETYRTEFISQLKTHTLALADDIWKRFWETDVDLFCNERPSAETVLLGRYNGYTVWTFTLGLQSIIEAERLSPGSYGDNISTAIETLRERYYNPEFKAYSAWLYARGDSDVYYDDNAQIAIALTDAFLLLHDPIYLDLARRLCNFLITGWTSRDSPPGGIQWHVGDEAPHNDRCCCSTAIAGVALLRAANALKPHIKNLKSYPSAAKLQLTDEEKQSDWVALEPGSDESIEEMEKDVQKFISFAQKCGDWLVDTLFITEKDKKGDALTHLIADKLTQSDDSSWKRDEHTILSYNVGTALHLLCLLHQESQISKDAEIPDYTETIHTLAGTAVTPYKAIFNVSAPNPEKRVWADFPYYTHLLIEGLLAYTSTFPHHTKIREVENMILHNVAFMKHHLSASPENPLFYHRNLKLTKISKEKTEEWNKVMGTNEKEDLDKTERVYDEPWEKLEDATMARTLLAQGGVARGFALVAGTMGRKAEIEEEATRILTSASLVAGDW
ncbi:uncharacterized protein DFL_003205 [Arthrobotrys flagrans]|uniref:Uncharacterized protein n=1 Tax=Arthrobotrys flagrans TaxID=97331 RepID=A0A437A0Z1_ARTFL|nr:hypothetical protein DFL_003205 [Arthrobotrys flagrans]